MVSRSPRGLLSGKRARRRNISEKTTAIRAALRGQQLAQPPAVTAACAAVVRSLTAVIATLSEQIKILESQVAAHFSPHPDAEIIMSQPGLGPVLGARVLAEFGDDPHRYASAKATFVMRRDRPFRHALTNTRTWRVALVLAAPSRGTA